ncbi:MAG: MFS transporter [Pseudomonadota bacterium]
MTSNTATPESTTFSLKPLMFESFACTMAMMAFVALAGPLARVIGLEAWQIGATVTVAGVAWMVMARVWGSLSDRRGRRPVLLFGLAGFSLSYFLLALVVDMALDKQLLPIFAFVGMVLARGVAGLFYAAVPPTNAALVADHVSPDERAGALAAIGASSAAGMVIGPGFAGLIGPLSLSLPLYLAAALPPIAFLVLWNVLPKLEAHATPEEEPLRLTDARLRRPMALAFVAAFSVSVAQITVGFFALDRLHLEPASAARAAGIALAIVGIALIFAQVILRKLEWQPEKLIRLGGIIAAIGFASAVVASIPVMLWTSYAVAAFGMGWVYPSVSALAANSVGANEQGAAAGSISASQGFGIIAGPIVGTTVYALDNGLPYALIAGMLVSVVLWNPHR